MANRYQVLILPLDRISERDDDPGIRLDGVDKILGKKSRFSLLFSFVKVSPGLVVPHRGSTGFSCNNTDRFSIEELALCYSKPAESCDVLSIFTTFRSLYKS